VNFWRARDGGGTAMWVALEVAGLARCRASTGMHRRAGARRKPTAESLSQSQLTGGTDMHVAVEADPSSRRSTNITDAKRPSRRIPIVCRRGYAVLCPTRSTLDIDAIASATSSRAGRGDVTSSAPPTMRRRSRAKASSVMWPSVTAMRRCASASSLWSVAGNQDRFRANRRPASASSPY
jgi:hypothetical protein